VLNGELVEDGNEVEGLGIEADMRGLLVRSDVTEVEGTVEVKKHMVMAGRHVVVMEVVRYAEAVVQCVVAHDEVVEGNVQVVADSVQARHDEAIDERQAKDGMIVEGS
jgi:hypothetical protein